MSATYIYIYLASSVHCDSFAPMQILKSYAVKDFFELEVTSHLQLVLQTQDHHSGHFII